MPVYLSMYIKEVVICYAQVETQGRYWSLVCKFQLPESGRYFANIVLPELDIPLGLLPMDGYLRIFKPIIDDIDIQKARIDVKIEEIGTPIDIKKTFPNLNQLPQAKLRQLNHNYYIIFTNQAQD